MVTWGRVVVMEMDKGIGIWGYVLELKIYRSGCEERGKKVIKDNA